MQNSSVAAAKASTPKANASAAPRSLTADEVKNVAGGNFNRAGTYAGHAAQPGFKNPTVISDDGINIHTSGASTSNVGYDSPFTPIPA